MPKKSGAEPESVNFWNTVKFWIRRYLLQASGPGYFGTPTLRLRVHILNAFEFPVVAFWVRLAPRADEKDAVARLKTGGYSLQIDRLSTSARRIGLPLCRLKDIPLRTRINILDGLKYLGLLVGPGDALDFGSYRDRNLRGSAKPFL